MRLTSFLAWKFLSYRERSFLVSFLSWMAVLGVVVSVLAFIIVEGVMSGFNQDLREKILGFSPHVLFNLPTDPDRAADLAQALNQDPALESWSSFVEGEAIFKTEEDLQGVRIRGIDPTQGPRHDSFQVFFEDGREWGSLQAKGDELPGILLGDQLARDLGVLPFFQEEAELLFPFGEVSPTGEMEPNVRRFRVIGTFKSGALEYDRKFVLVERSEAERLFGETQSEQVGVFLKNSKHAPAWAAAFAKQWDLDSVKPWTELHSRLFSTLKLERIGMGFVLGLMVLLASFNILSMLMMLVHERKKDLILLKALGLHGGQVTRLVLKLGFWIGLTGSIVGASLGALGIFILSRYPLPLPQSYYLDRLPVSFDLKVLILTMGLALTLSVLATFLPAREGRRFRIVEGLHYE